MYANLDSLISGEIYHAFLVFCRVGAAFFLLPGIGEQSIPQRIRLLTAAATTMAVYGFVPGLPADPPNAASDLLVQIFGETIAGIFIGTAARIIMSSLHVAGTVIAQQMAMVNVFGSSVGFEMESSISAFLMVGGIMIIFALDLHHPMIRAIVDSYSFMPAAQIPPVNDMAQTIIQAFSEAFRLGIQFAIPFIGVGFLLNVSLAAINRAMPQMPVFFIGVPIMVAGGFVILTTTIPSILLGFGERLVSWMIGMG